MLNAPIDRFRLLTKSISFAVLTHLAPLLLLVGIAESAGMDPGTPPDLKGFDRSVVEMGKKCRNEVERIFKELVSLKRLTKAQLLDTFYVPIPDTVPQKYHTMYDSFTDQYLISILDSYLEKDNRLLFVVAVDKNGYVPTHNSRYSVPLSGNQEYDTKNNRSKRLFNDRTGIRAARNKKEYLLQTYQRDTGETIFDLSVPVFIGDTHWGAIRIGYSR